MTPYEMKMFFLHGERPVEKITPIKPDPIDIKCSWDDSGFTIEQNDRIVAELTNDEAQYLLEQLILRFQPWGTAG